MSNLVGSLAEGFPIVGTDLTAACVKIFMRTGHGNTCPIANGGNQTAGSFCGPHHRIGARGCQETSLSTIVSKGMAKRRRLRRQISVAGSPSNCIAVVDEFEPSGSKNGRVRPLP